MSSISVNVTEVNISEEFISCLVVFEEENQGKLWTCWIKSVVYLKFVLVR